MDTKPTSNADVSLLSDSPASHDILNYQDYCDALVSIIQGLGDDTPITMGVFGDWGSGKTTLLSMVRSRLKGLKIHSIWVNVWQFGNEEDVWAAFLQSLLLNVKKEMPWPHRLLFYLGLQTRQVQWGNVVKKALELVLRLAIVVIPLYISTRYLVTTVGPGKQVTVKIAAGTGALLSTVLGYYLLLQPYLKVFHTRVKIDLSNLVKASPLRERVSLLDNFKTYFADMVAARVGEKGRLVIFVDDLDRCKPERIVQVLDAMRLFLDLPNCVYAIALDRDIVEQAIRSKFAGYKDPELEARQYLEKIVNLPFDLPPLSGAQMEKMVKELGANLPDAEHSAKVFALGQDPNPRKVKRTINIFLLLWSLSQRREQLRDLIHPTRLAKIVVIQHSYRELYLIISLVPQHLVDLEIYFRRMAQPPNPPGEDQSGVQTALTGLPDYLKPFTTNESLKRLFTLHPLQDEDSDNELNFIILQDGEFKPIDEEELQAYIHLTRTITPSHKKPAPPPTFSPAGLENFVDREAELSAFLNILDRSTPEQFLFLQGEPGIGKTALLRQFESIISKRGYRTFLYNLNSEKSDPIAFWNFFSNGFPLTSLKDSLKQTDDPNQVSAILFEEIIKVPELRDMGFVLLFDNYETATVDMREWIENVLLVNIIQKKVRNFTVVISGRVIPAPSGHPELQKLSRIMTLYGFPREVFGEYLRRAEVRMSEDELEALYNVSKGNPSQIASLLETLAKSPQFSPPPPPP